MDIDDVFKQLREVYDEADIETKARFKRELLIKLALFVFDVLPQDRQAEVVNMARAAGLGRRGRRN